MVKQVDWFHMLNQLRRQYKPLAAVAREIGCCDKTLQQAARFEGRSKFTYEIGAEIVRLYEKHCHDR